MLERATKCCASLSPTTLNVPRLDASLLFPPSDSFAVRREKRKVLVVATLNGQGSDPRRGKCIASFRRETNPTVAPGKR